MKTDSSPRARLFPPASLPRVVPAMFAIALALLCAGCWDGTASTGPAAGRDTLRIVDTLTIRDTVHDTVAPPLGSCSYRPPAASDTLAGDFAPLAIGNEWEYRDSSRYWTTTGVLSWNTVRTGTVAIKVIMTECVEDQLMHTLRFEFKGSQRMTQYDQGRNLVKDSAGEESHAGSLRCRDDGSSIACEGLGYEDAAYTGIFKFHRASVSDLQAGVDPITGKSADAILFTGNPPAFNRMARGVGALEFLVEASSGSTCCGFGHAYRASLASFNGIPAPYR